MSDTKERKHRKGTKKLTWKYKVSIIVITSVIALLTIMISIARVPMKRKINDQKEQEKILAEEIAKEKARSEEIDETEEYIGSDAYVEDVAKDKLGMAKEHETLIKPEK